MHGVEQCIKGLMRIAQYRKYKEVYQVDLDGNGYKDFIVLSWNMGTGLGANEGTAEIYLKEKKGTYHKISFTTMSAGIEDFVNLNKVGVITIRIRAGAHSNKIAKDGFEARYIVDALSDLKKLKEFKIE
jgi:hypothetical protein